MRISDGSSDVCSSDLLVKPIATRTRSGRGASSASKSGAMPAATRLSQLSRLSWVIVSIPFRSPVRRWPCHRPEHGRPRTPAREGGSGNRRGGAGAARPSRASHGPPSPLAGEWGGGKVAPHWTHDLPESANSGEGWEGKE